MADEAWRSLDDAAGIFDIITDFEAIRKISSKMSENWTDASFLPVIEIDDYAFFPREHVLNSLLLLYRRAFVHGHRFRISDEWVSAALSNLEVLHVDELIARANNVVAHTIHACSSTTAKFVNGSIQYSPVRPGTNKFDFDNLVAVIDRWLPFLKKQLESLEEAIRANPPSDDENPSEFFFAPWGSRVQLQALRTGRPQERTRNVLRRERKPNKHDKPN